MLELFAVAVRVAVWAEVTEDTVAVNEAVVALAAIVTDAGNVTAALALDRLTLRPPLGAAALRATVQASVPDPVIDAWLQVSAVGVTGAVDEFSLLAVPFSLTIAVGVIVESVAMVT